jgi:hypothetical protein
MPGQLGLIELSETLVAESEKGLDLFDLAKVSTVAVAVDLRQALCFVATVAAVDPFELLCPLIALKQLHIAELRSDTALYYD